MEERVTSVRLIARKVGASMKTAQTILVVGVPLRQTAERRQRGLSGLSSWMHQPFERLDVPMSHVLPFNFHVLRGNNERTRLQTGIERQYLVSLQSIIRLSA